jgi:hypothetical protein
LLDLAKRYPQESDKEMKSKEKADRGLRKSFSDLAEHVKAARSFKQLTVKGERSFLQLSTLL